MILIGNQHHENAYGKFLFAVNQYSTQSTIKRKREEEEKQIIVVEHSTIRSDQGDHRKDKVLKHHEM
jgi:hypothetical protein